MRNAKLCMQIFVSFEFFILQLNIYNVINRHVASCLRVFRRSKTGNRIKRKRWFKYQLIDQDLRLVFPITSTGNQPYQHFTKLKIPQIQKKYYKKVHLVLLESTLFALCTRGIQLSAFQDLLGPPFYLWNGIFSLSAFRGLPGFLLSGGLMRMFSDTQLLAFRGLLCSLLPDELVGTLQILNYHFLGAYLAPFYLVNSWECFPDTRLSAFRSLPKSSREKFSAVLDFLSSSAFGMPAKCESVFFV